MATPILPAFIRFAKETEIIGRLLAGYGELEFDLCNCLAAAIGDLDTAARVMFRTRGEEARIQIADALMRVSYLKAGLEGAYDETIEALQWCRRIRNQYAHCHWIMENSQLKFVQLEKSARGDEVPLSLTPRAVDHDLLNGQEAFFFYALNCLWYLSKEYQRLVGKLSSHAFAAPRGAKPPPAYIGEGNENIRSLP